MGAHWQDSDAVARVLNEWYPCTTLLLDDHAASAIARFCHEQGASDYSAAATGGQRWLTFICSGIARELDLPAYTEDVAAYEEALAACALSADAHRDAESIAEQNACLPAPGLAEFSALVPVLGRHVRIVHYTHDAPGIVTAIENCDRIAAVQRPGPCTALLWKSVNQR